MDRDNDVGVILGGTTEIEKPRAQVSRWILELMSRWNLIDKAKDLPDWREWMKWGDDKKSQELTQLLSKQVIELLMIGDHRVKPTKNDPRRCPYQNIIGPWLEQYLRAYGEVGFGVKMKAGLIDEMVDQLDRDGLLKPGLNIESTLISVAASTGSTQTTWQYAQMLRKLGEIRTKLSEKQNFGEKKEVLRNMNIVLRGRLAQSYGLSAGVDAGGAIILSQSGTDNFLTNALVGASVTGLMEEGATGGAAAASARHPSEVGIWGGIREKEEVEGVGADEMPKLTGLEWVGDAGEFAYRDTQGNILSREKRYTIRENWLKRQIAKIERNTERGYRPKRVVLQVTLDSKTGIGDWSDLNNALVMREKYGEGSKQRVVIAVDAAQGRLTEKEMKRLLELGVIIDITGSKVDEGPMFEAMRYYPPQLVTLARKEMTEALKLNNNLFKGLGEYYSADDLEPLLGKELVANLPDIPNIILSLVKWEGVLQARQSLAEINYMERAALPQQLHDLQLDLVQRMGRCGQERDKSGWRPRVINGHTYQVVPQIAGNQSLSEERRMMLVPFYVLVDGKRQGEKFMKRLRDEMSQPGETGMMVQIGQYVPQADVDRVAYGIMTELTLVEAIRTHSTHTVITNLNDRITFKIDEVIGEMLSQLPEVGIGETVREKRWNRITRAKLLSKCRELSETATRFENTDENIKYEAAIAQAQRLMSEERMLAFILMSGKNGLAVDIMAEALKRAKKTKELEPALTLDPPDNLMLGFVDHPYVLIGQNGERLDPAESDYRTLVESLLKYPDTVLYIAQATPTLETYLKENHLEGRYVTISQLPESGSVTKAEYLHPKWYLEAKELKQQMDVVGQSEAEAVTRDRLLARATELSACVEELNTSYKTRATQAMIGLVSRLAGATNRVPLIVRGTGRRKERAFDDTKAVELAEENDYLGYHPLLYMSESEVERLLVEKNTPTNSKHFDHFKMASETMRCGLDKQFRWQRM